MTNEIIDVSFSSIAKAEKVDSPRIEIWRFDLGGDKDIAPHLRTLVQLGHKLTKEDHFFPRAARKAEEEKLTLIDIRDFSFNVNMHNNSFVVQASVTFQPQS